MNIQAKFKVEVSKDGRVWDNDGPIYKSLNQGQRALQSWAGLGYQARLVDISEEVEAMKEPEAEYCSKCAAGYVEDGQIYQYEECCHCKEDWGWDE